MKYIIEPTVSYSSEKKVKMHMSVFQVYGRHLFFRWIT